MSDSLTLYKMIILYMLRRVTFPLTNSQITEFIIGQNYTDYYHLQEALHDLIESRLILDEKVRNSTQYEATPEGDQTLEYFSDLIPAPIRRDIDEYLSQNAFELRNESLIRADYERTESGDYAVRCEVREGKDTVISLTLTVPTEEDAGRICSIWPDKSSDIYADLMNRLLS